MTIREKSPTSSADESASTFQCIHEMVEEQAGRRPSAVAVQHGTELVTYEQLNRGASRLAARLLELNPPPESAIALIIRPSIDLIVAELAVMKAGCAFVPVDPRYPRTRVDYIMEDCRPLAILTTRREEAALPSECPVILLDDLESGPDILFDERIARPSVDNLIYILYTSGSTGRPKGVMVEHRNLCALIEHYRVALEISPGDRSAFLSSCSFDASIAEIWPYLASGGSVHIPETPHYGNVESLFGWLRTERITTALIPTALAEIGLSQGFPLLPNLRILLTGGDKLKSTPKHALPFRFINAYGPTECTVFASCAEVMPDAEGTRPPSIGKAISNAYIRILDEDLEPTPVGVAGEIYIGGAGVARGYFNRAQLTRERFVRDHVHEDDGQRLYRTGDRGCWRSSGEIAFLGRSDRQVQIRGHRIEPAEIEFVLKQELGVDDAVVLLQERTGYPSRLIGFIATQGKDADLITRVKTRLDAALPGYMHPAMLIPVDQLPFNAHGKIDAACLPMPSWRAPVATATLGSVSAEERVRMLWCETLGIGNADPTDDFFDSGGDSISITTLLTSVEKLIGVRIPMGRLLQDPTLGQMLSFLRDERRVDLPDTVVRLAAGSGQIPLFIVAGAGGGVHWFRELISEAKLGRPVFGLESQGLAPAVRANFSVGAAADEFTAAILKVQPSGPFLLAGYSLGGMIAVEITERLRAGGAHVDKLILLDTYAHLPRRSLWSGPASLLRNFRSMTPLERETFGNEKKQWLRGLFRQKLRGNASVSQINAEKDGQIAATLWYMANEMKGCGVLIELFTAKHGTSAWNSGLDRGWLRYANAGLIAKEVSGDHYTFLRRPNVHKLAEHLADSLEGIQ